MRRTYFGAGFTPAVSSVWDYIDKVLTDTLDECECAFQPSRQIRELQTNAAPYTDIFVDEQKQFVIQAALAGVAKEDIKITSQNYEIELSLFSDKKKEIEKEEKEKDDETEPTKTVDDKEVKQYLQRGIKKFDYLTTTWKIPKNWDMEQLNVKYENGLLTITIPLKKEELQLMEKKQILID